MGKTTWSGPLRAGYAGNGTRDPSLGYARLSQTFTQNALSGYPSMAGNPNSAANALNYTMTAAGNTASSSLVQTISIQLPANAQIIGFEIDALTAYDSATSAYLTIGQTAGGFEYVGSASALSVKTTGRLAPTYTVTQLTNMLNIGTNTTVYATVTSVGAPGAGVIAITCNYIQW